MPPCLHAAPAPASASRRLHGSLLPGLQVPEELRGVVGDVRPASLTYRLFKLPKGLLEEGNEDYGQCARYQVRAARRDRPGRDERAGGLSVL